MQSTAAPARVPEHPAHSHPHDPQGGAHDAIERPPALVVCNGTIEDRDGEWPALGKHQAGLAPLLRSVGRIHNEKVTLGTGFYIGQRVVVTNRHVAESFSMEIDGTLRIRVGWKPTIDFLAECCEVVGDAASPAHAHAAPPPAKDSGQAHGHGNGHGVPVPDAKRAARFPIESVLYVDRKADLALLRVTPWGASMEDDKLPEDWKEPAALQLSFDAPQAVARDVCLIGFPDKDLSAAANELRDVFHHLFDVKRVQPGRINRLLFEDEMLGHDASTLRGNSGSPVIDLETYQVIGLHASGSREKLGEKASNLAVAFWLLNDEARRAIAKALDTSSSAS